MLKLAHLTNNYAALMMFSTPSRSHQQSSISGCCAVFVWKSHPVCMTSASSDQEEAFQGDVLALIPTKQSFFQKSVAAYCQLTLLWSESPFDLVPVSGLNTMAWAQLYNLQEMWWLQTNNEWDGKWEEVSAPQQMGETAEGKQSWWGEAETNWMPWLISSLPSLRPGLRQTLEASGPGQREGRGRQYFKWKRCSPWGFLALSVTSWPPSLHTSVQGCDLSSPCLNGHGAQPPSHSPGRAHSPILVYSRNEDGTQGGGGWMAKYWEKQRVRCMRRCLGRS